MTAPEPDSIELAISRIVALAQALHPSEDERSERRRVRAAWAWDAVRRYRSFIGFALDERSAWGKRFVETHEEHRRLLIEGGTHRPWPELFEERRQVTLRTHFAIESYFTFGKVLLDRVVVAIEATFGNAPGFRPKHGAVFHATNGLVAYAKARGVSAPPQDLLDKARALEETLTRFRDHMIVHPQNVRLTASGTIFTPTGEVDLGVGVAMPTNAEIEAGWLDAPSVARTADQMEEYLAVSVDWVELGLTELVAIAGADPGA